MHAELHVLYMYIHVYLLSKYNEILTSDKVYKDLLELILKCKYIVDIEF